MFASMRAAFGRTVLSRLLGAFLALAVVLVGIGVFGLTREGALHSHLSSVTSRDLTPLADLRAAQNTGYQVTIHGLVAVGTTDSAVVKLMTTKRQAELAQMAPELQAVVTDTPAELRGYATDLVKDWDAFTADDLAYQQGVNTPDAARLNQVAAAAFDKLNADFDSQAERRLRQSSTAIDQRRAQAEVDRRPALHDVAVRDPDGDRRGHPVGGCARAWHRVWDPTQSHRDARRARPARGRRPLKRGHGRQ